MTPLSKSKAKYIKSLQLKKSREKEHRFIVEGNKSVLEFLSSNFIVEEVVGTEEFYAEMNNNLLPPSNYICNSKTLSTLGTFKTNNSALAIVQINQQAPLNIDKNEVVLALDEINDPGNLGTLIRVADWYGVKKLLLSTNSVDVYNPKVVSATKGSLTRVKVYYVALSQSLADYEGEVYAADMQGTSLSELNPINSGIILMGSESHGVSHSLDSYITERITIPRKGGAESLNVAVAAGIICNHLLS